MKIYLAGPEVFLPNAREVLQNHVNECKKLGYEGLSPLDNQIEGKFGIALAKEIFLANKNSIKACDIVLANCNPFRLATVDDGTAWEIGYAFGLGKKIFGYIEKKLPLVEIVKNKIPTSSHSSGYLIDENGYLLNEDFGNSINLMLEFSILESGGELIEGNFSQALGRLKALGL